jgi:hypothetical protein
MEQKSVYFGIAFLIFVFSLSFVSSAIIFTSPANGTNYSLSSFGTLVLNVTFLNGTDIFVLDEETTQTNVNVSFYSLSGVTETLLANSSSCALTSTQNLISCWTNITIPSDGFFNLSAKVMNATGDINISITNLTDIYFDSTPPIVLASNFSSPSTSGAYGEVSGILELNVSIYDLIGFDYGKVFFNITNSSGIQNATYDAELVGGYWVNDTALDTTHFPEGRYNITVFANDSLNNLNNTGAVLNVIFDNTSPSISLAKTSSTQNSLTIAITVSDALSGVTSACTSDRSGASISGTGTSQTLTESGLGCGTSYTYTVTCSDVAGNSASTSSTTTTVSFTTSSCSSSSSSSGSTTASTWKNTFVESDKILSELGAVSKALGSQQRIKLNVNSETHYVGVKSLTSSTALIEVTSDPQQATMSVGDVRKFDLDGDGYYDLEVKLNSISDNKADLSINSINEPVTAESEQTQKEQEKEASGVAGEEDYSKEAKSKLLWMVLAIILLIIIVVVIVLSLNKSKK